MSELYIIIDNSDILLSINDIGYCFAIVIELLVAKIKVNSSISYSYKISKCSNYHVDDYHISYTDNQLFIKYNDSDVDNDLTREALFRFNKRMGVSIKNMDDVINKSKILNKELCSLETKYRLLQQKFDYDKDLYLKINRSKLCVPDAFSKKYEFFVDLDKNNLLDKEEAIDLFEIKCNGEL